MAKIAMYKGNKFIKGLDFKGLKTIQDVDNHTMKYSDEAALKLVFLEKGYIDYDDVNFHLYFYTEQNGKVKKTPLAYRPFTKYIEDDLYLYTRLTTMIDDEKFMKAFIREFCPLKKSVMIDENERNKRLKNYREENKTGLAKLVENFDILIKYLDYKEITKNLTTVPNYEMNEMQNEAIKAMRSIISIKTTKYSIVKSLNENAKVKIAALCEGDEKKFNLIKKSMDKANLTPAAAKKFSDLYGADLLMKIKAIMDQGTKAEDVRKYDYSACRKFAMFLYEYDKKKEKEMAKQQMEEQMEQLTFDETPESYLAGSDAYDEPAFPPNSEESALYLKYLQAIDQGKDGSEIMEELETGRRRTR